LRKRRRRATERQTWYVTPGRLIDQRPAVVLSRDPVGDCEGDLIVGRGNRSAIATLVDRPARSAIDAHSQLAYSAALNDEATAIALAFWTRPQVRRPAGITVKRVLIDKRQRNIGRA
jgi:IS30 family transposase